MTTQERINAQGRQHVADWAATVREFWRCACTQDGIPPESKFVVFSKTNAWAWAYNQALKFYLEALGQYRAGGYVGLRIGNGRAQL